MNASSAAPVPQPSNTPMRRRWRRPLVWLLGLWAAAWLLGWLGLPPLLRWQLQTQLQQWLQRPVAVQAVTFRPWSMELEVLGLRVGQPTDGTAVTTAKEPTPTLQLERLYLDAELQSLLRWAPVVDAVALQGLQVQVRHLGQGRWDVDDVLAKLRQPSDEPDQPMPRFAVFNIALDAPALTLVDEPVGVTHRIEDLALRVPFLSNLGARREVATEPQLSFRLNGQPFQTEASTTPFASSHATEARLRVPALDIAPYLPYWPANWPLRPQQGRLDLDLRLAFEQQQDTPQVTLQGLLGVAELELLETRAGQTQPLFTLPRLTLALQPSQPLAQRWHVGELALEGPQLWLRRNRQGELNWPALLQAMQTADRATPASTTAASTPGSDASNLRLQLDHLHWQQAQVHWADASTRPAAAWVWQDLSTHLRQLQWPLQGPATLEGALQWAGAPLQWQGELGPQGLTLNTTLSGWPLATVAPYLASQLKPALDGTLGLQAQVQWTAGDDGGLRVQAPMLQLDRLRLGPARAPLASLQRLEVADTELRWPQAQLTLGRVTLQRPQTAVRRDANGRWMVEDWLVQAQNPAAPAVDNAGKKAAEKAAGIAASPDWTVRLQTLQVRQGRIDWAEATPAEPVQLRLDALRLDLRNLQPLARRQADMPLALNTRLQALDAQGRPRTDSDAGQLDLKGRLRLPNPPAGTPGPLRLDTQVTAERLPLQALLPYAGSALQMDVLRADTSARGRLTLDLGPALALRYQGDMAVEDFSADSLQPRADLLDWKSLALRGIDLQVAPDAPLRLAVGETVLSDYYARLLVSEQGRLNLQDLWQPRTAAVAAPATAPAMAPTTSAAVPAPASTPASPGPAPDIRFGPMSLVQGQVDFADRFIRPNYSARLSELSGSLSAFASNPPDGTAAALANLALRGRVEGTATLDISGQLNPLATPLALDIRGQVKELELPPLSPYSSKYAGHGIERGKLSMDVRYQVTPDGQLQASNQVVLNQLHFGERDAASEAPNLPVKLAVALLADRNGVIDINLPISGSINDPQFRLGPIIVKVIFNLIAKAVTAPFSLLASALSDGGEELSTLPFNPGQPTLAAAASERLQKVAKAMQDRPGLSLTVVGHASLPAEREAYRRVQLDERVRAEKRRLLARQGQPLEAAQTVSATEYPVLLKAVYQRADIPKPRNFIGLAKDIPQAEMETLLLTSIAVPEDAMRNLALARAVQVKDQLVALGVDSSRLFLAAPQLASAEPAVGSATADKADAPPARAELQLGTR